MKELFGDFKKMISAEDFDNILVVCHENPDGDAVGSAWALAHILRLLGKNASAYTYDEIPPRFFDIAEISEDFRFDRVITTDVASPNMIEKTDLKGMKIDAVFDHHIGNSLESDLKIVVPEAAACGEIIFHLAKYLGVKFDHYLANCLYTAISTDTGCFKYSNVTSETFAIAGELFSYTDGEGFSKLNHKLFDTNSLTQLKIEAACIDNTALFFDGKVAFCAVDLEMKEAFNAKKNELDNIINIVRTIEGVRVAFVAKEKEKGIFKVSVRSDAEYLNASDFCKEFGGGGHAAAAGCSIEGGSNEVCEKLIAKTKEYIQ